MANDKVCSDFDLEPSLLNPSLGGISISQALEFTEHSLACYS